MQRSVDELIEAAVELDERTTSLVGRLARITPREGSDGIEVTVNLDGRLIGLELTEPALRRGADALAAEITRLTQRAAAAALADGMATLAPLAGEDLGALLEP